MSEHLVTSLVTIVMAIIGVAIIAVLVSKNSQTSSVLGAGSQGFAGVLGTALSPVTGSGLGSINFTGGGAL